METDLSRIQELGEQKRDENHAFRRFLKVRRHSDRTLRHLAERIETQIDCRACANCCRLTTTGVSARDIKRLSSFLRRSIKDVLATFTVESEDEGLILQRTNTGACVFLDGNDCTVYDARPET